MLVSYFCVCVCVCVCVYICEFIFVLYCGVVDDLYFFCYILFTLFCLLYLVDLFCITLFLLNSIAYINLFNYMLIISLLFHCVVLYLNFLELTVKVSELNSQPCAFPDANVRAP